MKLQEIVDTWLLTDCPEAIYSDKCDRQKLINKIKALIKKCVSEYPESGDNEFSEGFNQCRNQTIGNIEEL